MNVADNNFGFNWEDAMTSMSILASAQPAEREHFMKSILPGTVLEGKFKAVVDAYIKSGETATLSKAFKDEFNKAGELEAAK
jgi:hypothetical protein